MNLNLIPYIIEATVCVSIYLILTFVTFKNNFKHSQKKTVLISAVYLIYSVIAIELFCENISPFANFRVLFIPLWVGGSIVFALITLKVSPLQVLFYVITLFDIQINIMMIALTINGLGFFPRLSADNNVDIIITVILVIIAFFPFMWYLFAVLFRKILLVGGGSSYWKYIFILPITYFVFCWFGTKRYQPVSSPPTVESLIVLVLLNLCSFISYVALLKMLLSVHKNASLMEKARLNEQLLAISKDEYRKMENHIEESAVMRHDIRHHMIAINGYTQRGDLDGLKAYLDTANLMEDSLSETVIAENHFIDILLRHYMAEAAKHSIHLEPSIDIAEDFPLPNSELCIILSNLIENAIEACLRQTDGKKFIKVKARMVSDSILAITVANSFSGSVQQSDDAFISSKRKGAGIGTKSVRAVVEKYGGSCTFQYSDNVFKANILISP